MNSFIEPNENNFNNEFELDKGKINYEFPRNHLPLDRMKKYNTITNPEGFITNRLYNKTYINLKKNEEIENEKNQIIVNTYRALYPKNKHNSFLLQDKSIKEKNINSLIEKRIR